MLSRKTSVGSVFLVVGVLAVSSAQEPQRRLPVLGAPEPASEEMLAAKAAGGLKISLAADRYEAKAGDAVKLTLTFENVSQESLRVFMPIEKIADEYLVVRAAGPSVLRSGVQVRNMMAFLPGPQSFPEIKPGEKRMFDLMVTGNPPTIRPSGVILGAEGEYKIQVVYTYPSGAVDPQGGALLDDGASPRADANFMPWRGTVVSEPIVLQLTGEFHMPGPVRQPGRLRPMVQSDKGAPRSPPRANPIIPDFAIGPKRQDARRGR